MLRTRMAMLRVMRSRLVTGSAVGAAVLLLGACGGGGDEGGGKAASPTAGSGKTETAPASARVVLSVAGVPRDKRPEFGTEARVKAKDAVRLTADVRDAGSGDVPVRVRIPKAAAKRLEVTARVGDSEEQVTIRAAGGKDISLEGIRYSCTLPPQTVCPAEVRVTDSAYELTFSVAEAGPPVGIAAIVA